MMTLRSSIRPSLKGETLRKGALFSAIGGLLLLSLAFMPFWFVKSYGLLLFFISALCIARGLVPYRKLLLEEIRPNELHFDGEELFYLHNNKPIFKLHKKHISQVHFKEKGEEYGIALQLAGPLHQQIIVMTSRGRFMRYLTLCKKRCPDTDLYLPFFSQRSHQELLLALRQD